MYGRSGFKTFIFDDHQLFAKPKGQPNNSGLEEIKEYSTSNFEKVAEYDRKLSPYDRTELLEPACHVQLFGHGSRAFGEDMRYDLKPAQEIFPSNQSNIFILR